MRFSFRRFRDMAITAFSQIFQRELEVRQLKDLHSKHFSEYNLEADFNSFVLSDVICSCCKVSGAKPIKAGISKTTNTEVKQEHFAFRQTDGSESHSIFCDHYLGSSEDKIVKNDSNVNFRKSNSLVTQIIRKFICTGIDKSIFSQKDVMNMREWFLNIRSKNNTLIEDNTHLIEILRLVLLRRNDRNKYAYTENFTSFNSNLQNIDIELETYKALAHKIECQLPQENRSVFAFAFSKNSIVKKASSLSKVNNGLYIFDFSELDNKFSLANQLSFEIIKLHSSLAEKLGRNRYNISRNNPLMAYSSLLLFVNDWNIKEALSKHKIILDNYRNYYDENLGNVIGLNPFTHYHAWKLISFTQNFKNQSNYLNDINIIFEREKEKIKNILEHSIT